MLKKRIFLWLGVLCLTAAIVLSTMVGGDAMLFEQPFTFASTYLDKPVTLEASLFQSSSDAEYGVLVCPGYSCDRQKWTPVVNQLVRKGFAVMSFDYSGQGASQGVIGFDNAKTDAIPAEIDDAIDQLCQRAQLDRSHVILLGHSMGGRSILRLMYDWYDPQAVTRVKKESVGSVILISPEVNYRFNAQASLFAGTSDEAEEPWHSYNSAYTKGTNVYLYGSTADDIVSDEDILAIYRHLGGVQVPESGMFEAVQYNQVGDSMTRLTVGVTDGVLHSYQMYSPKFAAYLNNALDEIWPNAHPFQASRMSLVYACWTVTLLGLFFTLHALTMGKTAANDAVPVLTDTGRFLRHKALMWLPGVLAAFVICCLCVCMPFGSPVMNIPYMCFIAGYGVVMLLAYRKGRFKGVDGKLPKCSLRSDAPMKHKLTCLAVTVCLCFVVWYVLRATMYRLIPLNFRLFWVLAAAVLMAIGYYVSGVENDMMDRAKVGLGARIWYNAITYVPLFLLVGFYLVIKSYSGMIGQVQNMVLMYIFCIPLGDYIRRRTGNRLLGAVTSAFLFQTLMITSAALISMF